MSVLRDLQHFGAGFVFREARIWSILKWFWVRIWIILKRDLGHFKMDRGGDLARIWWGFDRFIRNAKQQIL
jgi:hypothetical protein